jgi:two-component system sensor histidine kinase UhpB
MENAVRVLHIEDNPDDQLLVKIYLKTSRDVPIELVQADLLKKAQDILRHQSFDVALMDLNLPDRWGTETYNDIHTLAPLMPVIVLSGAAEDDRAISKLGSVCTILLKENLNREILIKRILQASGRRL